MEKIKLIYILGMGRSGSTLLDLLLGAHPELTGTGEFTNFAKWLKEDEICTCQKKIRHCSVWSKVIAKSPIGSTDEPITPVKRGKLYAASQLIVAILKYPLNKYQYEVAIRNHNLLTALLQDLKSTYIVDSSKAFTRLCFLERSGLFSLKVIHLVRDGRGVANSKKKKKNVINRQWNLESKKPRPVGWTARVWTLTNMACLLLCYTLFRKNFLRVRYEDLASNPNFEMQRIVTFLNIPMVDDYSYIPQEKHHNIAGNSSRFDQDRRVILNEKWRDEFNWQEKVAFVFFGGAMNKLLGYKFFYRKNKNVT